MVLVKGVLFTLYIAMSIIAIYIADQNMQKKQEETKEVVKATQQAIDGNVDGAIEDKILLRVIEENKQKRSAFYGNLAIGGLYVVLILLIHFKVFDLKAPAAFILILALTQYVIDSGSLKLSVVPLILWTLLMIHLYDKYRPRPQVVFGPATRRIPRIQNSELV